MHFANAPRARLVSAYLALFCCVPLFGAHGQERGGDLERAIQSGGADSFNAQIRAQASANPPQTDDPHELSVFHHKRGSALHWMGENKRAVDDLTIALRHVQPNRLTTDRWGDRNRIENELGDSLEAYGDWFAAIEHWRRIVERDRSTHQYSAHWAMVRLSGAHASIGAFAAAERTLKESGTLIAALRHTRAWSTDGANHLYLDLSSAANLKWREGDNAEAERLLRLALTHAEANLRARLNRYAATDQRVRSATGNLAKGKLRLGDALAIRGKAGEAEYYVRLGIDDLLTMYAVNTSQVGGALGALGWVKLQQGDVEGARRYYGYSIKAIEASAIQPSSTSLARARRHMGHALTVESRWREAIEVFEQMDRGLRHNEELYRRVSRLKPIGWALALAKIGRPAEAATMAEERIADLVKATVPNARTVAEWRATLGMAQSALGRYDEALQSFRQALPELLRNDSDETGGESAGFVDTFKRRVLLEAYVELMARLHTSGKTPAGLDAIGESFRIADIARGSGVQEAINATATRAQLPDGELAALARSDQSAKQRIISLGEIVGRLAAAPDAQRLDKVIGDMRADIARLRAERKENAAQIRAKFPEYAELIDPRPVGIDDLRRALAPGEAAVSIYIGERETYVWTLGKSGQAAFHVAAIARSEMDARVARVRSTLDYPLDDFNTMRPFDAAGAHQLYRDLLEPHASLWGDASTLNIVTHGVLGELPLGVLLTAAGDSAPRPGAHAAYKDLPFLIRKVAVAQLPSATAFVALRRAPPPKPQRRQFAGFGDPVFASASAQAQTRGITRNLGIARRDDKADLWLATRAAATGAQARSGAMPLSAAFEQVSALPDTAEELREIAALLKADLAKDLFLGSRATEGNVKRTPLEDRRVVAFATHGVAPGEVTGLDQPALILSNPKLSGDKDEDGFLTMEEVLGLKLDADWVVLSACNTGSASKQGGEAVSGLGRAFFYAGARSLLVSNWPVETTSARLLTTSIFRRQAEDPALSRAEALRQSMLSLMSENASFGTLRVSYAHPLFWAPFSLVGDSGSRR